MKRVVGLMVLCALLGYVPNALAQEWTEVTENSVGDRFLVDRSSIRERGDNSVRYWEYRDFRQPNNVFVEEAIDQPVYGAMLYQSVDCASGVSRMRQVIVHGRNRQELERFNYGDDGKLAQPAQGSSASAVLQYVCTQANTTATPTPTPQATPSPR